MEHRFDEDRHARSTSESREGNVHVQSQLLPALRLQGPRHRRGRHAHTHRRRQTQDAHARRKLPDASGEGPRHLVLPLRPEGRRGRDSSTCASRGFALKKDAQDKAEEIYRAAVGGADGLSDATVGEDLHNWIKKKRSLARTTRHGYEEHIALYLEPQLGHIKRRGLRLRHVEALYDAIERENAERLLHHAKVVELEKARDAAHTAWVHAAGKREDRRLVRRAYLAANAALREGRRGRRKITSAATMHRINATLSSFLGSGVKRGEYATNWAAMVELPAVKRPKALVWTPERVEEWKRTGQKPSPVMVWTPEQTGQFLDFICDDRLYGMWHGFIFRGPRRGEMAALPWTEVSLSGPWFRISAQVVEVAYRQYDEAPKQDSVRTVTLDALTRDHWQDWRITQAQERDQWSGEEAWVESNRVWTHENGEPLHPDWISRRFNRLVELSGLPPVRLHDTRHLSATLALLGGADIKVVQERLGHSSRQITSDTYTSVLPQLMTAEAESTSAVVPRTPQKNTSANEKPDEPETSAQDVAQEAPDEDDTEPNEGFNAAA
ncbi:site-specific integrase [Streptomyces sp. CB01201]|uniref:tyrosine-type recombinase/integrase n=1 Tax=Streptomyces sp. CB01201 TaxID=2020324 RepID=UPI000C26EF6C|nr:site-specific integrase [Streptomyces sp. CB01201]PJM99685.1 site-specific integrase [Streptomyces sp. CB01201]